MVEKSKAYATFSMPSANSIRVLFVEDDALYRESVCTQLSRQGFAVRSFADGASLLAALDAAAAADVVVLDWGLPDISGIDLLIKLRQHGVTLPVVFLTGYGDVAYESQAFAMGAIDFVDKARGVDILVRRLRLVVDPARVSGDAKDGAGDGARDGVGDDAKDETKDDGRVVVGRLALRPGISRAYWDDVDVRLTVSEYEIVDFLTANAGNYRTYRDIYDRMHYTGFMAGHGEHGYRTNVRSMIKRIRIKFRELDPSFAEIENSISLGYRWRSPTNTTA
jgi:two-component system response regulator ChvI